LTPLQHEKEPLKMDFFLFFSFFVIGTMNFFLEEDEQKKIETFLSASQAI
jgi:hypothetical protein